MRDISWWQDLTHSCLLDELIQCVLLVLPFSNLKCIIDPFGSVVAKHINFLLILTFLVHAIGGLTTISNVLFLDASFNDHWDTLILLSKFDNLVLQVCMNLEILQSVLTHPTIDLFVKLNSLRLDCRLRRQREQIQVFRKSFQIFHSLNTVVVQEISNQEKRSTNDLYESTFTLGFLLIRPSLSSFKRASSHLWSMYQNSTYSLDFLISSFSALSEARHFSITVLITAFWSTPNC